MPLILHIDVDAFFASVEQLLIPSLRGRAVIVGSGVIASCSYHARRFGLRAGMSLREAGRLCPEAVVLKGDSQIYRCFAEHVWDVCRRYTCGLETYLDEAYGDAGGMERIYGDPLALGRSLQRQVRDEVKLPVSIGLADNRMLAKLASASAKPGGVAWVAPGKQREFLQHMPVRKLLGVGHKTERKLRDMNVTTVAQLRGLGREFLRSMSGRRGEELYDRACGRDSRTVAACRLPKTISRETTFHRPTCEPKEIRGMLFYLLERAMRTLRRSGLLAGAVELRIRYDDWKHQGSRRTMPQPTACDKEVFEVVQELLGQLHRRRVAVRHVGIVLSRLVRADSHPRLFEPHVEAHNRRLHAAVDAIRDRYGHAAVVAGKSIDLLGHLEQNDYGFVLRTPSLTK